MCGGGRERGVLPKNQPNCKVLFVYVMIQCQITNLTHFSSCEYVKRVTTALFLLYWNEILELVLLSYLHSHEAKLEEMSETDKMRSDRWQMTKILWNMSHLFWLYML